jgi:hypothetical protein
MDASWFTNRLTIDDLRSESEYYQDLLDAYQEGDEIWEFDNPARFSKIDCVAIGVVLVRNGVVVDAKYTIVS